MGDVAQMTPKIPSQVLEGRDFERFDDLAGLDLEDEVARMTPEDEERWLRAS